MSIRLAIGKCSCRNNKSRSLIKRKVCELVLEHLHRLENTPIEQLRSLPEYNTEEVMVLDDTVFLTTFRADSSDNFVVQAFIPTFIFPTYFSFNGIGHILADGLIIDEKNNIKEAKDCYLWEYR